MITTTQHAQELQSILISILDQFCPTETFKISTQDKPWMNQELKKLKRRRMREYQKRGKTEKYLKLAEEFKNKYKSAAEKFLRRKIETLKSLQSFKIDGCPAWGMYGG